MVSKIIVHCAAVTLAMVLVGMEWTFKIWDKSMVDSAPAHFDSLLETRRIALQRIACTCKAQILDPGRSIKEALL